MMLTPLEGFALMKVQPELVAEVFDYFSHEQTWENFLSIVENGAVQLWRNEGAVLAADITQYPTGLVNLHIIAAQGDMDSVLALVDEVEEWAYPVGVHQITVAGRKGWERVGKPRGYELREVVLAKQIQPV